MFILECGQKIYLRKNEDSIPYKMRYKYFTTWIRKDEKAKENITTNFEWLRVCQAGILLNLGKARG